MKGLMAIAAAALLVACSGGDEKEAPETFVSPAPTGRTRTQPPRDIPTPGAESGAERQQQYNLFLERARQDVAANDPAMQCSVGFIEAVIEGLSEEFTQGEQDRVFFAMYDACVEAGHLPGLEYSDYYDDAP